MIAVTRSTSFAACDDSHRISCGASGGLRIERTAREHDCARHYTQRCPSRAAALAHWPAIALYRAVARAVVEEVRHGEPPSDRAADPTCLRPASRQPRAAFVVACLSPRLRSRSRSPRTAAMAPRRRPSAKAAAKSKDEPADPDRALLQGDRQGANARRTERAQHRHPRRRARGHRHRDRRRRTRPHDRLSDHRGRRGHARRPAGPHAACARRRLRSRDGTRARARGRSARCVAAAVRRFGEARRARPGDDRQSRRRRRRERSPTSCRSAPFTGNWEYMLEQAIFTSPPTLNWSGAALISKDMKLVGVGSLIVREASAGETARCRATCSFRSTR